MEVANFGAAMDTLIDQDALNLLCVWVFFVSIHKNGKMHLQYDTKLFRLSKQTLMLTIGKGCLFSVQLHEWLIDHLTNISGMASTIIMVAFITCILFSTQRANKSIYLPLSPAT